MLALHVEGPLTLPACAVLVLLAAATDAGGDPTALGAVAPASRVAVQDFVVEGVDSRVARVVQESLVEEVRKLERVSVISMEEVRAMLDLEAQRQLVGCDEEASCLAEIAGALGADVLVTGTVARVGDEHIIGVKRIDQRRAEVTATFSERLSAGDGSELLTSIGPAVERLFPEVPLRQGRARGVDEEVARRINPPPLPPWAFWTGAGTGGALAVATVASGAVWLLLQADYKAIGERARAEPVDGALLVETGERAQLAEIVTWTLVGATAVAGGATLALTPFVDWLGYGEDAE